jgi:hypothetical protein
MKTLLSLIAVGVWGMPGVAALLAADEPKPVPKAAVEKAINIDDINREIEALKKSVESQEKLFHDLSPRPMTLGDDLALRPLPGGEHSQGKVVAVNKEWGFVVIDNAYRTTTARSLEEGGVEYQTSRMTTYEAERRSAEKIEQHVREADAKARVLLRGGAPSHITPGVNVPKAN